ncbi:MAG: hypothetical protein Q9208_001184 [Pyrenodesmia sp. 3 TL-2023]
MAGWIAPVNEIKRFGLTEVFRPTDSADVDIVFVHGINGDPHRTWTSDEGHVFWPADLLPAVMENDKARVLVYGYDVDLTPTAQGLSKDKIYNHAEQLVAVLSASRRKAGATERPIIFVAHSVGGIIIKRAMIHSSGIRGHHTSHLRSIFVSTFGILFLGTPHMGSDVAKWRSWLDTIYNARHLTPSVKDEPYLMNALKTGSETLQSIERDFVQLATRFHIYYFHEGKPTNLGETSLYMVDELSASPVISDVERATIQQDHLHMCKFENQVSPGFDLVTEGILRYASQAPRIIQSRWEYEKSEQHSRKELAVNELLDGTAKGIERINLKNGHDRAAVQTEGSHNTSLGSTTLSGSKQKSFYLVPRERVANFLGREDQLQEIATFLSTKSSQQPKVLILHALGGQGKSQIALEYCQRSRSRNQYRGIFWINASSEALAIESYTQIAKAIAGFTSASEIDAEQIVRLVKDRLESWTEKCLLVFDNYDQPERFPQIQKFFPKVEHCHVLFTSRHGDLSRLGSRLRIPGLSPEEGVSLLLRVYENPDIENNFATALQIVERLGYLALAIDQAAAYIRYRRIPPHQLEKFLGTYESQRKRILKYTPSDFWEYSTVQIHGEEDQSKAINAFTTWEMSLEQLKSRPSMTDLEVLRLLTVCSYLNTTKIEEFLFRNYWTSNDDQAQWLRALGTADPADKDQLDHDENEDHFGGADAMDPWSKVNSVADMKLESQPKSTFSSYSRPNQEGNDHPHLREKRSGEWDPEKFWDILHDLDTSSLVQDLESDAQGAAFSLHPLIRDWLQLRESTDARRRYMKESFMIVSYSATRMNSEHTAWAQRRLLLAHIDACISNDERLAAPRNRFGSEIADCSTADTLSTFYLVNGKYKASEEIFRRVQETRAANLGEEHTDFIDSVYQSGLCLLMQERFGEAEQMFRHTLRLRARVLGEEHPETLKCMVFLGQTLKEQKKFFQAECIFRQHLQMQVRTSGQKHQDTLAPMLALASTLSQQGKHDKAEELSHQALQFCEQTLGVERPETQDTLYVLTTVLARQTKFDEAKAYYLRCLRLCEALFETGDNRTAFVMRDFGLNYYNQGEIHEAETVLRRALELQQNFRGEQHHETQRTTSFLARVLYDLHNYDEAQLLYSQLLEVQQNTLGKADVETLKTMEFLALILRKQDKHDEADKLDRERLELEQMKDE